MLRRLRLIIIMNIVTLGIVFILCGHMSECQMLMTPFPKVHNQIFELLQGSKDKETNDKKPKLELEYSTHDDKMNDECRLREDLMSSYSPDIRPVNLTSTISYINVTLTNLQILRLDEQNQIMVTKAHIYLAWFDENLKWIPDKYGNMTQLVFQSNEIWIPDIALFNSADTAYSNQRDGYLLRATYDGHVTWVFVDMLKSYCSVDIRYFPFDTQTCVLEFQPWSRSKDEVMVVNDNRSTTINFTRVHTEWQLLSNSVDKKEENNYVWLEYKLVIKRNWSFYVNSMLFPFSILSSLSFFVFWLPPDSGEKITLTITILLALTLFLQIITDYTPKAAKSLPIIALYYHLNLILVLISIILTIIVLNFHFRGPKKQRVPKWMRKYLIGYLGRVFCFSHESKFYLDYEFKRKNSTKQNHAKGNLRQKQQQQQHHQSSDFKIINDNLKLVNDQLEKLITNKTSKNDDTTYNHGGELINYTFNNECHIKLYRKESYGLAVQNNINKNNNATNSNNELSDAQEIAKHLEKMLGQLSQSLDPLQLKDDNLKLLLMSEIVECQRNLLSSAAFNNTKNSDYEDANSDDGPRKIDLHRIYDEWKILAMVVDRICFFIYLTFLFIIISWVYLA